ncbi:MAG: ATP-binding protein [Bacteroidales bacterium]|nr:ATP-binding protein [Bacteroidales bacterium]
MIERPYWLQKIDQAWKTRPIVWLSGVRRVGKTSIAKMLPDATYLNCDLPSVVRRLEDPESFFQSAGNAGTIIFDEIHRLADPSNLLKIAADEYPHLKILATGSSTLEATQKFKDSLTGRKSAIYLPPVLWDECKTIFGIPDLDKRLLQGGLPEQLLSASKVESFFSEWIDSFYARDIQELFNVRNRAGFLQLLHLLLRSSGNLIDYTQLAKMSAVTRPTVLSYLEAMRIANMVYLLPPFHGSGRREIVKRPKCFCFDTGLVCFAKGWNDIRPDDRGLLWEHMVLDMLRSHVPDNKLFYWRDKSDREIDFVIKRSVNTADIIECKINPDHLSLKPIAVFREIYPNGNNYCYTPFTDSPYVLDKNGFKIKYIGALDQM